MEIWTTIKKYYNRLPWIAKLNRLDKKLDFLRTEIETNRLLLGRSVANAIKVNSSEKLTDLEFKVFSQWNEDGIIQYLTKALNVENKKFIEFGVEDYREANTRYLMMNDNWSGLIIDSSQENIKKIRDEGWLWKYDISAICAFVDKDNINELITQSGFGGDIGLLSIDIDGNDYWVWQAIDAVRPTIVVIEYNSLFGNDRAVTVPYQKNFSRSNAHSSFLYFGASLPAIVRLGEQKGYVFVGCESHGSNAFFVRKDKITPELKTLAANARFVDSKFRQGRGEDGRLNYLSPEESKKLLKGLEVFNVKTSRLEKI